MAKLPQGLSLDQTQNTWATVIEPLISKEVVNGLLLSSVHLVSGTNTINHRLGRKLIGWFPTRVRASATFYDTQDTNQTPQLTLTLTASADVVADIWVF